VSAIGTNQDRLRCSSLDRLAWLMLLRPVFVVQAVAVCTGWCRPAVLEPGGRGYSRELGGRVGIDERRDIRRAYGRVYGGETADIPEGDGIGQASVTSGPRIPARITGKIIKMHGAGIIDCVFLQDSECIVSVQLVVSDLHRRILSAGGTETYSMPGAARRSFGFICGANDSSTGRR
jgi:hypothetical protein